MPDTYSSIRTIKIKDCTKGGRGYGTSEPLYPPGGNVHWFKHLHGWPLWRCWVLRQKETPSGKNKVNSHWGGTESFLHLIHMRKPFATGWCPPGIQLAFKQFSPCSHFFLSLGFRSLGLGPFISFHHHHHHHTQFQQFSFYYYFQGINEEIAS